MKHVWEQIAECGACQGTGVFVGRREHDGAAVVCHSCDGTGSRTIKIEWSDFEGRKVRDGVNRVFQGNPGIGIREEPSKGLLLEDFGGLGYEAWRVGKPFTRGTEMRAFTCPAWWFQTVEYALKPNWDECIGCGAFTDCKQFRDKAQCWARHDRERQSSV